MFNLLLATLLGDSYNTTYLSDTILFCSSINQHCNFVNSHEFKIKTYFNTIISCMTKVTRPIYTMLFYFVITPDIISHFSRLPPQRQLIFHWRQSVICFKLTFNSSHYEKRERSKTMIQERFVLLIKLFVFTVENQVKIYYRGNFQNAIKTADSPQLQQLP